LANTEVILLKGFSDGKFGTITLIRGLIDE